MRHLGMTMRRGCNKRSPPMRVGSFTKPMADPDFRNPVKQGGLCAIPSAQTWHIPACGGRVILKLPIADGPRAVAETWRLIIEPQPRRGQRQHGLGRSLGRIRGLRLRTADPAPVSVVSGRGQHRPVSVRCRSGSGPAKPQAVGLGAPAQWWPGAPARQRTHLLASVAVVTSHRTTGHPGFLPCSGWVVAGCPGCPRCQCGSVAGPRAQGGDRFGCLPRAGQFVGACGGGGANLWAAPSAGGTDMSCSMAACPWKGIRRPWPMSCAWMSMSGGCCATASGKRLLPWHVQWARRKPQAICRNGEPWQVRSHAASATMPG